MIVKILLGPVLLVQAWWVRYKTPKLPEPVIQLRGVVGAGPKLRLLLIGDSSAAGVGVFKAEQSLIGQLINQFSQTHQLDYELMAKTGETTASTLNKLVAKPAKDFDLVLTALGVNDVTSQISVKQWRHEQLQLIELIRTKFRPQQIILSGLPPMADFPALSWPLNRYLGRCADQLNQALITLIADCNEDSSQALSLVKFHSLRGYPKSAQTASDGFHPSPEVYALWASHLYQVYNDGQ